MSISTLLNEKVRDIYADAAWLAQRIGRISPEAAVRYEPHASHELGARPLPNIAISRDHVFPGPILLDLKTGSYFVYTISLPSNDEDARVRNLKGSEMLMGTFITQGKDQNAALIATAQGFTGYQLDIARKALGEDKVDEVVQSIERGEYFSPDMHAKIFAGIAAQAAVAKATLRM